MKLFFAAVVVLALVHSAQGLLFGAIFSLEAALSVSYLPCSAIHGAGAGAAAVVAAAVDRVFQPLLRLALLGEEFELPMKILASRGWSMSKCDCQLHRTADVGLSFEYYFLYRNFNEFNLLHYSEVMHPNRPCGCQPAGATFDPLIKYCNSPPPNATMYCETAANGASSQCKVSCTPPDMKYNPAINRCIRDKLTGCTPPEELAAGPRNEGCVCLASSDPDDGPLGEKCGYVPYNPGEQALGYPPPGRMVCIIDPADITNSKCIKDCLPQYKESGLRKCVPKGP
ncbi:hypothetical protein C8R43DRAFT_1159894 [Mycena crocata]|nr:hypothetical protein C8R43DRAFT_1159894 [Mycena crocata]